MRIQGIGYSTRVCCQNLNSLLTLKDLSLIVNWHSKLPFFLRGKCAYIFWCSEINHGHKFTSIDVYTGKRLFCLYMLPVVRYLVYFERCRFKSKLSLEITDLLTGKKVLTYFGVLRLPIHGHRLTFVGVDTGETCFYLSVLQEFKYLVGFERYRLKSKLASEITGLLEELKKCLHI